MKAAQRIIIAGGGLAGHKIAYELQRHAHVTLLDPKDFFEIPMAAPRLMVAPGSLPSMIPYQDFLPDVTRVQGRLIEVRANEIIAQTAAGPTELGYDYLVLATGSNYRGALVKPHAGGIPERLEHFRSIHRTLDRAERILIVGGGAVGVELAGEILDALPSKQITLVESGTKLLPLTSDKPRRWAGEYLQSHGVRVFLGQRIVAPTSAPAGNFETQAGESVTDQGTRIPFDAAFWCIGLKPDASYLRAHFSNALDPRGLIRVSPELRVVGHPKLFAVGDINDLPEKGGFWVQYQAKVAVRNLQRLLTSPQTDALIRYKRPAPPTTMVVTLGSKHGVMDLPFGCFRADWMARRIKSETMLVPKYRKGVGV